MEMERVQWFFKALVYRCMTDKVFDLAAQLAFYLLLALFPFLILLFSLLSFLPISADYVLDLIQPYAPEGSVQLIGENLYQVLDVTRGDLLSFSMAITVWLSAMGTNALIRTLNNAYRIKKARPLIRGIVVAMILTGVLVFGVIISLLLPIFGREIGEFVFLFFDLDASSLRGWEVFRWSLSFVLLFVVFACLYYAAPNERMRLGEILPGTIFAALGWQLASLGFSYYVEVSDYSLIYGNLGTIVILMLWFYLSSLMILIGGEINAILKYGNFR